MPEEHPLARLEAKRLNESAVLPRWSGDIAFGPMLAIFAGTGGDMRWHRSPMHKIVVASGTIEHEQHIDGPGIYVIPAFTYHRVHALGQPIVIASLDARHYSIEDAARLAWRWRALAAKDARMDNLRGDADRLSPRPLPARIARALEALNAGATIGDVAAIVGLSESRLSHLFQEVLGAPPRTWRNWLRLRKAIDLVGSGMSMTDAAHEVRFADSAHFSRACVSAIGIQPSVLGKLSNRISRSTERCDEAVA